MNESAPRAADDANPDDSPPTDPTLEQLESDLTVVGEVAALTPPVYPEGLTSQELALALRGEMLDHFLLEEYIGGGGMGVVFRALDTTLDRMVAVKVVASHRVRGEDLQRRFLVEAQSAARLDHPNVARVHYVGRDRGLPYIVFEYIEGQNLRDLLERRGPLPPGEALSYAYQIAHALSHACDRDVVHRDIKPSNILITPHGQAKLVDMGLARLQRERGLDSELTADGMALGTFDYISPEQARDARQADVRSDIYSLGCTLYFMLAGRPPFAGGAVVEKLVRHQTDPPPPLDLFRGDLSPALCQLVDRMLAKDPAQRHQTARDLIADLGVQLAATGVEVPQALAPIAVLPMPEPTPAWRRHAVWAVPGVALLLVTLGLDRLWGDAPPPPPLPPLASVPVSATAAPSPSTLALNETAPAPPAAPSPLAVPPTPDESLNAARRPPVTRLLDGLPFWGAWTPPEWLTLPMESSSGPVLPDLGAPPDWRPDMPATTGASPPGAEPRSPSSPSSPREAPSAAAAASAPAASPGRPGPPEPPPLDPNE